MKKINPFLLPLLASFILTACHKETLRNSQNNGNSTGTRSNTAPEVFAGPNVVMSSGDKGITLFGTFIDREYNIKEISWTKISGPDSYLLENKNSIRTQLSQLEKGEYQFELAVTDLNGLFDKDTLIISVNDLTIEKELIFEDCDWSSPWEAITGISSFHNWVPYATSFRVYIQRENDPKWIHVAEATDSYPGRIYPYYEYFTSDDPNGMYGADNLVIFYYGSDHHMDKPSIKIVL